MKITMPKGAAFLISTLEKNGFEAYAVGGCVRDSVLGKTPADWDITTNAFPEEVMKIFRKAGCGVVPTGIKHGTVTVLHEKCPYEVTTYRIDGEYKDGRKPEGVVFTSSLEFDLERRDFTINAMAYNDSAGLIDLFGGITDLENKMIRCVGNADERISEDYLRMLRAYRFAAALGFEIDDDIKVVSENKKDKLSLISAERIRVEFEKTIVSDNMQKISDFMKLFGEIILPESEGNSVCGASKNLHVRLASLLISQTPQKAENALRRLKYDNKTIKIVADILKYANNVPKADKAAIKFILSDVGKETFVLINELQKAMNEEDDVYDKRMTLLKEIVENNEPYMLKSLNITGDEIMKATNGKPGQWLGLALKTLLNEVINNPLFNEREKLIDIIRKIEKDS